MKKKLQNWQEGVGWNSEKGKPFVARVRDLTQKKALQILRKYEKLQEGQKSHLPNLTHASLLDLLMRALIDGEVPEIELPPVPSEGATPPRV